MNTLNKVYTWSMDLSGIMQGAGGDGGLLVVLTNRTNGLIKEKGGNQVIL